MKSSREPLDPRQLPAIRATAAVALSISLQQMFPKAIIIGARRTDVGFICECIFDPLVDDSILPVVERQMTSLLQQELDIVSSEMLFSNMQAYYNHHKQSVRAALLENDSELVEIARIGDYIEPCQAPYAPLNAVRAFKLLDLDVSDLELADGNVYPVTTISGTAFGSRQDLKQFLKISEKAAEVDHRRLGRELGLYDIQPDLGAHLWQPKGNTIRDVLISWWQQQVSQQGFTQVRTPISVDANWLQSVCKIEIDHDAVTTIPPYRAPLHALLYATHLRSYRELPIQYAECSPVSRPLRRCDLWGVFSQPDFISDESSVFCRSDQVKDILTSGLQFINKTVTLYGFRSQMYLLGRGIPFAGTIKQWDKALEWLQQACETAGITHATLPNGTCFEGPRLEVRILDALGREWSGPSIGFDFGLPERLGLCYQTSNDTMDTPLLIKSSTFASVERFVGLLVEHYGGQLPLWLAPEQVRILPVQDDDRAFAAELQRKCSAVGLRAYVDDRHERLGAKVFAAETAKVPQIVIVGAQERKLGAVTLRGPGQHRDGARVTVDELITITLSLVEKQEKPLA